MTPISRKQLEMLFSNNR